MSGVLGVVVRGVRGENRHDDTSAEELLTIKVACAMGLVRHGVETSDWGAGVTMGLDVMLYNGRGDVGVAPKREAGPAKGGGDELEFFFNSGGVICKDRIPETRSSTGQGGGFCGDLEPEEE